MEDKSFLKKYKSKRDFKKSPEPPSSKNKPKNQKPIFVIQKHQASRLHYDFRLEIDGVLKSWAIPKGPSLNPAERRLAISVEDHPLAYAELEGVIPEGNYGAGRVEIWDKGSYQNIRPAKTGEKDDILENYREGKIEIKLKGEKLKGDFALIQMKQAKEWLLIKMKEDKV